MKGRKPNLTVVSGPQENTCRAPAWLPKDAKAEWAVATADLAARGLLFRGAMGTLASYCVCIAAIRQRQAILDRDPGDRESFQDQIKAISQAKQLAVELGLTVTSRSRAFTAKTPDKQGWDDVLAG
jgi:P27 family predicted phage terminase small subunit